tara:strand:- start:281 stop:1222 length:942 start_codon:yes stop_codon:yes gene_type:complete
MRHVFINELIKQSKKDKDIYLITADLGFKAFEKFHREFPERFINLGVAENNMIGVGAGMALQGKKVFVYSILPFVTFRSLEQIRNNICHNNLNVKLVGGGGGFSYSVQGISHNTSEDLSVMRSLPNMSVYNPGSKIEAEIATQKLFDTDGPGFIRLGKAPEDDYYKEKPKYKLGDGLLIQNGDDLTIFCSGNITKVVMDAASKLKNQKINAKIVSMLCLKPINSKFVVSQIKSKNVVTVEEHSEVGGLGSAIADILMSSNLGGNISFKKIALSDRSHKEIGSQDYLRKLNSLDSNSIVKNIINLIKKDKNRKK